MLTEKFFAIAQIGHEATLYILVILSIVSVAFILERARTLSLILKKSEIMKNRIQEVLMGNSLKDIEELAKDRESVEGRALAYGIRHTKEFGAKGIEEIFSTYAQLERPGLEKHLNFLATVGSNAPFIGLLGTVFGIMEAFRGLASSQGASAGSNMAEVLNGISQSLVATATGLLVAIPAVIAYNFFQKRVKRIMQSLDCTKDICVAYAKVSKG